MKTVLITGGSGLVGTRLTNLLLQKGYRVTHLSRQAKPNAAIPTYKWDLDKNLIDQTAIATADYIIHLAGAGIADKRWSTARKKLIVDSRVNSTDLLYRYLRHSEHNVKAIVAASAIGFYGNRGSDLLTETSLPTSDFLSTTTQAWEKSSRRFASLKIRTTLLRIGIVLSTKGGALPKMALPLITRVGNYLGNGQQYYSWIHIDDLCQLFIKGLENNQMEGIYNAVAPNPVTNKQFIRTLGEALNKSIVLLPVPAFMLRLALGEMADVVLTSSRVSSKKLARIGFIFSHSELLPALRHLYHNKL